MPLFKLPQERKAILTEKELPQVAARLHPLVKQLMLKRDTPAIQYFNNDFTAYESTLMLHDAEKSLELIRHHIVSNNTICVYGDYDVDGITATSIMVSGLLEIASHLNAHPNISWYIPSRVDEGYGLSMDVLSDLSKNGTHLVVTVDCGVSAIAEVAYARSLGLDVIITDHHTCLSELPNANAVVNPRIAFDGYTGLQEICGAAVVFKLLFLYSKTYSYQLSRFCEYGAMASMATVADVMRLEGENRLLVTTFLKPGKLLFLDTLSTLLKKTVGKPVDISFSIAPHINSVGRIGTTEQLDALISSLVYPDAITTENVIKMCVELNVVRKEMTKTAIDEAVATAFVGNIVVARGKWHQGIVGILAGNLAEKYSRPAFVFTELQSDSSCLVGSARSFGSIDLYEKVSVYSEKFDHFGGHAQALGLTIKNDDFDWFVPTMDALFSSSEKNSEFKIIEYDLELSPIDITNDFMLDMERLAPFGYGNLEPVFLFKNVHPTRVKIMKDVHAKFSALVNDTATALEFLMFNAMDTDIASLLTGGSDASVNLIGTVAVNVNPYNGVKTLQCLVQHCFLSKETAKLCDRALFEKYFRYFRTHQTIAESKIPQNQALPGSTSLVIAVFVELGYLTVVGDTYVFQEPLEKKPLSASTIYSSFLSSNQCVSR